MILVNDHGEPVEALLGEFDFPLTYIYKGRNEGLSAARNSALALARGRYVCYLDDDDCYAPSHLQTLLAAFEEHGECVVYTGVEYVAERIEAGERVELSREVQFVHDSYDRERLFIHNYIPVNTWAHPRSMLRDVGQFDTSLTALEGRFSSLSQSQVRHFFEYRACLINLLLCCLRIAKGDVVKD